MMLPIQIIPQYRLMMRYDIRLEMYEPYYHYVTNEFVPALQNMGLYMIGIWHTAYGEYPLRQVEFVTDNLDTVLEVFQTDRWRKLEGKLQSFTNQYERKLVRYRDRFQF
ncbi:MAG: hypothetical protein H7Y09_08375 [Chitinophagaceae bacterium]|nr:hypothetical protein [Anaerolineae bacterium]